MKTVTRYGLIRPQFIRHEKTESANEGVFVLGPLERGFGNTLGMSMRKLLMQSLPGSAICEVLVDSCTLFSSQNLDQRTLEIFMALKEVRLVLFEDEAELQIASESLGDVLASDIFGKGNFKILNQDHPITFLAKGERLKMRLRARRGRGYVSADAEKNAEGWIPLDALYSPVQVVKCSVGQSRVGERTDYEELKIEIKTDGSISARSALIWACRIFIDQLGVYAGYDEVESVSASPFIPEEKARESTMNHNLSRRIEEFELSVRSANCLVQMGIDYVWQLAVANEKDLLKVRNMGVKSLRELEALLSSLGLTFGMNIAAEENPVNATPGIMLSSSDGATPLKPARFFP